MHHHSIYTIPSQPPLHMQPTSTPAVPTSPRHTQFVDLSTTQSGYSVPNKTSFTAHVPRSTPVISGLRQASSHSQQSRRVLFAALAVSRSDTRVPAAASDKPIRSICGPLFNEYSIYEASSSPESNMACASSSLSAGFAALPAPVNKSALIPLTLRTSMSPKMHCERMSRHV